MNHKWALASSHNLLLCNKPPSNSVVQTTTICCCCSVTKLCSTLCHPMDCSSPGSSVHEILQARMLDWVAISSSRGSSPPKAQICVSYDSQVAQCMKNLPIMQEPQEMAGSIPGLGRSHGEGNGNPLQYSCLGDLTDKGAWWASSLPLAPPGKPGNTSWGAADAGGGNSAPLSPQSLLFL